MKLAPVDLKHLAKGSSLSEQVPLYKQSKMLCKMCQLLFNNFHLLLNMTIQCAQILFIQNILLYKNAG